MSFVLECPTCGPREVTDFAFGGELRSVPTSPDAREFFKYIYFRRNVAGRQREWWYHRSGCRSWFMAERDTASNEVFWTASVDAAKATAFGSGEPAGGGGGGVAGS